MSKTQRLHQMYTYTYNVNIYFNLIIYKQEQQQRHCHTNTLHAYVCRHCIIYKNREKH